MGSPTRLVPRAREIATVACLVALVGCYRTAELPTPLPEPGTRIVAELTPTGAEQMEAMIGPNAVGVEARVAAARPQEWELSLLRVDHRRAPSVRWNGEPVAFPVEALRSVRERELDAWRTAGFTAGLSAALFLLARNFMWGWVAGDGGPGEDPVH